MPCNAFVAHTPPFLLPHPVPPPHRRHLYPPSTTARPTPPRRTAPLFCPPSQQLEAAAPHPPQPQPSPSSSSSTSSSPASPPPYDVRTWNFKSFSVQYAAAGDTDPEAHHRPALVLVHGFGANCLHWRHNLAPLAANGWRVYAMDLLGFGMGAKPLPGTLDADGRPVVYKFEYWTAQLKDFVTTVVNQRGPDRPVFLIANSIGAMVVMQTAVEAPHLSAAQVFISPSLRQLNVRKRSWVQDISAPALMRLLNYRPLGAYFLDALAKPDQLRRVLLSAYSVAEAVDDDLVRILRDPAATENALDVFLSFIMYDDGPIPEDYMPLLSQPSLVIWGEDDRFEPFVLGEALRHYATVDQFLSFPNVGHCAHDEIPDQINAVIAEFVQRHLHRAQLPSG